MSFHQVTWNPRYRFATVHNYGCTFHCPFCSYKLRSGASGTPGLAYPAPARFLAADEIKDALRRVSPEKVYFMGGEPTVAADLGEILRFAKHELGCATKLGHTNGSKLPLPDLDGANVGFKAFSPELHREITGRPRELIYGNFEKAFHAGTQLAVNMVFVPGLVDTAEFDGLTDFLASLDRTIPLHIMGYIPVPGESHRAPERAELDALAARCRQKLDRVATSLLTPAEALNLSCRDDRFQVEVIAGSRPADR